MKLSLEVLTPGKGQGKHIPITLPQFLIGRDPQCHLRPVSAAVSKRHCAIMLRNGKIFVRDFESTNGTFINDEAVKGERELRDRDRLKVGPLLFQVHSEETAGTGKPTPPPASKSAETTEDDSAAAMLLAIQDDATTGAAGGEVDSQGVPTGSTVMEIITPSEVSPEQAAENEKAKKTPGSKNPGTGNTSTAAKAILEKYMRRPRT